MTFIKKIVFSFISSIIIFITYYSYIKYELKNDNLELLVEIQYKNKTIDSRLEVYKRDIGDYKKCKIKREKIYDEEKKQEVIFDLENSNQDLKQIRLDFKGFHNGDSILLKKFEILNNKGKNLVSYHSKKIVEKIYQHTSSIKPYKRGLQVIKKNNAVFDPYIIFNTYMLFFYNSLFLILILTPWIIIFLKSIFHSIKENIQNKNYEVILISLVFIVMPLKIAWVSFSIILLLIFSIGKFFISTKKSLNFNIGSILLILLFLIFLLFGRIKSFESLKIQYAFVLISLIFLFNKPKINYLLFFKIYIQYFFIIMTLILLNFCFFSWMSKEYYDLTYYEYFIPYNTKAFNEKMTWWLPYSHPTFLPSFCIVGIFFCNLLRKKLLIKPEFYYIYILLCCMTIVLLGSRLMMLTLLLFLIIIHWNKISKKLLFLEISTSILFLGLILFICSIDTNRYLLWRISYDAISDNIWGYGLGSSKEIIQNLDYLKMNGYDHGVREDHSHNQFITIFLELGIVALLLFTILFKWVQYLLYKTKLEYVYIYFLFFILMITESPFETATPTYFYTFVFCLLMNENKINKTSEKSAI